VQTVLDFSPMQTGFAFLPMIFALVLAAQLGTNIFVPRLGPKIMVPVGMTILTIGMLLFTRSSVDSTYAGDILLPLIVLGLGMGTTMPAAMQTATLGVDRQYAGVASAMVNTSQQVGGSIGVALLNTLAATAATDYLAEHQPPSPAIIAEAAIQSYDTAYLWSAGIFAFGAIVTGLLFRRRSQGLNLSHTPAADDEPVIAH
jgi:MFS family permease